MHTHTVLPDWFDVLIVPLVAATEEVDRFRPQTSRLLTLERDRFVQQLSGSYRYYTLTASRNQFKSESTTAD
jgi:hypothetical protein